MKILYGKQKILHSGFVCPSIPRQVHPVVNIAKLPCETLESVKNILLMVAGVEHPVLVHPCLSAEGCSGSSPQPHFTATHLDLPFVFEQAWGEEVDSTLVSKNNPRFRVSP